MPDSATANILANALGAIADLNLAQSQESLTDQLQESIPILNALGLYDAADHLRLVIAGEAPNTWAALADMEARVTEAKGDAARAKAEADRFNDELTDVNRRLHIILGRPFKLASVLPLNDAVRAVAKLVKNQEKQRRRNQRKAQMALHDLAVAEGRAPDRNLIHPEAAIHEIAVRSGQDRATRKACALARQDPSTGIGRLMLRAGWLVPERRN